MKTDLHYASATKRCPERPLKKINKHAFLKILHEKYSKVVLKGQTTN